MLQHVTTPPLPPERFVDVLTPEQMEAFDRAILTAGETFSGRVVWNVNSTANGGGVAEMLRSRRRSRPLRAGACRRRCQTNG